MPPGPVGNANLGSLRPVSSGQGLGAASLTAQLEALYRDVIACGSAARGWFDGPEPAWRAELPAAARAQAAMASLAVTARLLAVMNWLLDPANKARAAGPNPQLSPICHADAPPLADDHPFSISPGGAIARTSRQLLARAEAISALHAAEPS